MRSERLFLVDMLEYARKLRDRATSLDRATFDADLLIQLGITHALQIIGEAARQVSEETRLAYPTLPWKQIVGMRHRVVHEYFAIDSDRVWDTLTTDLPELIRVLERDIGPLAESPPKQNEELSP